jgi:hypothetical protein
LAGAHALFSFAEKQDSHKPERQCQVGIVKDRASSYGELITAFATSELLARINPPDVAISATRTFDGFRPPQAGEDFAAIFIGGELLV